VEGLADMQHRHAVPSNLRVNIPDFKAVFDVNNYKCQDYYGYLIKKTYERPRKWAKIGEEFDLMLPMPVSIN